ncbi:uncharacterized protein LY89DRAFT_30072 [Mollisia scopiformis]|uniref:Uncharacterized protein n=1 Tax=Mollisia scopiformis TaxID=149040 RepID=A0A194XCL4_MOLSC|nr:uncharacterized protein LY89DRAFT_30072 [Mollisia scopiformis]KUJ17896.1 hypothetical protein LY89DRAFT_30072 [Mollisia scopiformis]
MFEHFTFGAQAQTSYIQHENDEAFPSPTDCSFRLATPPPTSFFEGEVEVSSRGGINDLVNKLSTQSLRPDDDEQPQRSIWTSTLPSPDFSTDTDNDMMPDFTPEELSYISTGRGKVTLPSLHSSSVPNLSSITNPRNGTVACRRLQRQLNVQLQTCSSHVKDISALVEDMIETSSQCRLHTSPSTRPFVTEPLELDTEEEDPSPLQQLQQQLPEDEGFAEMEDEDLDEEMTLRRASTPSGIRKWNVVRYRASGECIGGPPELAWMGRRKVRCVPRMRRRKPKTVAE